MNRRTRAIGWIVALAMVPAILAGCGRDQPAASQVGTSTFAPDQRQTPPAITGTTTTGAPLALADLKGKVVVLNSWASWCGPCRDEIPAFVALAKAVDPADVAVIGLNVNDDAKASAAFAKDLGMDYPSIVDGDGRILATIPDVPPSAIPSTVILDRSGRIAARIVGRADPKELSALVTSIAAEPA